MSGTKQTLVIVASFAVLLGSIALAGWLIVGSTVVASTGTLRGGWHEVFVEVGAILGGGIGLAILLFWIAARKPKPLRVPED